MKSPMQLTRREFVGTAIVAAFWPRLGEDVTIVEFSDAGTRVRTVSVPNCLV